MDKKLKRAMFYKKLFPRKFPRWNPVNIGFVARLVEKKYFEGDELYCLPKDGVIQVGQEVDASETILPSKIVEHFIREASYRFVMNKCICRECMPCQDYPIDIGCIFLGEGARGIHPELGREVSEEEALDLARRAREAGLVHSVGKSKLDTVWLDIGPGDKLFTICHCCPCCCITRGIAISPPLLSGKYQRMPGVKVVVTDECAGCGTCVEPGVCIFGGIVMKDGVAETTDSCRGCGRCVEACPSGTIEARIEDAGFVSETIERLSKRIDVK